MPYCAQCRPPAAEAVAVYTSDGPSGYRQAGACAAHTAQTQRWAAQTGGPVTTTRLTDTPIPDSQPQLDLFASTQGAP